MKTPEKLVKGDLIYLTAPAKAIDKNTIDQSKKLLEELGFKVLLSENILGSHGYFSAPDFLRAKDFQVGLDHEEAKAIVCVRGGYGCIRILPYLNWAQFLKSPKWVCGFSDVTVLHHRLFSFGIKSLHSTMPLNFQTNTSEAISSMQNVLMGNFAPLVFSSDSQNKMGKSSGILIGGNLSIIYSLLATDVAYDFNNKILFIEDLGEQLYHIDRILHTLERNKVFEEIQGLLVGGMTDMKDTENPTGFDVATLILEKVKYRKIPVCFHAPFGHIQDNRALIIGNKVEFLVDKQGVKLTYL